MWLSSALVSYGHKIVKTIGKGTDIQVTMGIAPTKTLVTYYTKVQYKYKGGNYLLWLDEIGVCGGFRLYNSCNKNIKDIINLIY